MSHLFDLHSLLGPLRQRGYCDSVKGDPGKAFVLQFTCHTCVAYLSGLRGEGCLLGLKLDCGVSTNRELGKTSVLVLTCRIYLAHLAGLGGEGGLT